MGQYYIAVILGEKPGGDTPTEFIRTWINPHAYKNGSKLMEHSYVDNNYVRVLEWLLSPNGYFWKSRLVWAGDYADSEPGLDSIHGMEPNLYTIAQEEHEVKELAPDLSSIHSGLELTMSFSYYFLVNHTKKQWVHKRKGPEDSRGFRIHPLPLLTAEGNGRGGGDYHGAHEELVGSWARDVISVEYEAPAGFTELVCEFAE